MSTHITHIKKLVKTYTSQVTKDGTEPTAYAALQGHQLMTKARASYDSLRNPTLFFLICVVRQEMFRVQS